VPGHTLGHIAYYSDQPATPLLFCGDTLFAAGCGRMFEGTPEQMQPALARLAACRSRPKSTAPTNTP
jgi:Metallo-beta-lactamase superfamily.